ncbi:hypothetical protein [Nitrosospira sp. Nsp13]|uniref:hypothetical protein n=1 Tax=Nitrosospira sp. Nsp13 TaxID=1855332 RepID=UPI00088615EC|nr:hypothetical protein [Nitrosospira sp. Nsp13]SCX79663.1 hypothetical protein SAMN05216308_101283 [Nitrosospira sp. Nsp13]
MSIFDAKSRYVKYALITTAVDRCGRTVVCVTPAEMHPQAELGRHKLRQGQRLDHLASHYLGDPAGFWRIAQINDAITVEAVSRKYLVSIPTKG